MVIIQDCGKWIKWITKDELRLYEHKEIKNIYQFEIDDEKDICELSNLVKEYNKKYNYDYRIIDYDKLSKAVEGITY